MTSLLTRLCNLWTSDTWNLFADSEWNPAIDDAENLEVVAASSAQAHPSERTETYGSLIELRQQLQSFAEPSRTTVLLVLDSQTSVHLPTLLKRDTYAYRLILTTTRGELLSTYSAGDLALQSRACGWFTARFERDEQQALEFARTTTEPGELLLVLTPEW